ncbi:MAG: lysophospholipid acyltransferase family protein [Verrucomicrobiales bacterium]
MKPSSFYQASFWSFAVKAAGKLPAWLLENLAVAVCASYRIGNSSRRNIVAENLAPVVGNDPVAVRVATRRLFRNFALKLADLWRFEAGIDVVSQITTSIGWEVFDSLRVQKRGILLLTPHVGNWEFGAPLLAAKGVKLQVITQPEPEGRFTEMRQKARERWGIETVVVGSDPFAFIEVIRKLDSGAVVALLVDRPPSPTSVQVQLFGRNFAASIAPAELARATGCALIPVCLPRLRRKYVAQLYPEIIYTRAELGNRSARGDLAQKIMTSFEPAIRQYADQWYHFVPIWPN